MNARKVLGSILFVVMIVTTGVWGSAIGLAAGNFRGSRESLSKTEFLPPDQNADVTSDDISNLTPELLAKAAPDECYNGIGVAYPQGPPCEEGIPKVNEAYVWGMAKYGNSLWFGTAANVVCAVIGGYLSSPIPHETDSWVCEFGENSYSPLLPETLGDWRPTSIYRYDLTTESLVEMTPADPRVLTTGGIRSAGAHQGVILMAGPSLLGGIDIFAYNGISGDYLGSTNLPEFTNIRKWILVDDILYTAVRSAAGNGHVLRWAGDLEDPFQFEIVGNIGSEGAELAFHAGRLYVSTWPNLQVTPIVQAGIYMSPVLPASGLTSANADEWQMVWKASDYEPDPVTAATYGGGALASFDGYLYWGTMHVPFTAAIGHFNVYGTPSTRLGVLTAILSSHRAISIFRARDLGTPQAEIELLYGEKRLPVYVYNPDSGNGVWLPLPNNMGTDPLWGGSGFDNFYNNYTWTMAVYDGQLFIGTMDWSYLFNKGLSLLLENIFGTPEIPDVGVEFPLPAAAGADLMKIESSVGPAYPESLDGIGNFSNYGIRTMLSADALYLGTANPMNLMTALDDDLPEGGWELLRLQTYQHHQLNLPLLFH